MKPYTVSNPTRPGARKPVELITDRAKRYRANRNPPEGARQCCYCGSKTNVEVEHVDGNEDNAEAHNLVWACRSCNTQKGIHFARNGKGKRTRQYNPKGEGARSVAQWVQAVMVTKGMGDTMTLNQAIDMIHNTPQSRRSEFAREIWSRRREHGTDTRGGGEIPF